MKTRILRQCGISLASAALLFTAVVPAASASLILSLTQGALNVTVIDNSPAGTISSGGGFTSTNADADPTLGVVHFNGPVGSFSVNITTGVSKPVIGPASIDLNSITVSGGIGGGTLFIGLTDTDFGPIGAGSGFKLDLGGTTQGTVSALAAADEGNGEFQVGSGGLALTGNMGPGAFSTTVDGTIMPTALASLTEVVAVNHNNKNLITSFDGQLQIVPEPASLGLLGIALFGLGFVGRKRMGARAA